MRKSMNDAETRLRAKLRELPDGTWTSVAHQDSARSGDRGIYKIVLKLTKRGDRLTFDFTGTDPQVDGLINCTYAGLRGGIMPVLLTTAVRRHSLGARAAVPVHRDHQRARHHQQLHVPGRHRQGVGGVGLGHHQRRHRVPQRHARRPSGAPPAG